MKFVHIHNALGDIIVMHLNDEWQIMYVLYCNIQTSDHYFIPNVYKIVLKLHNSLSKGTYHQGESTC